MVKKNKTNKKVVMVSGGFDPIHIGHIRYMKEAKKTRRQIDCRYK